MPRGIHNSPRGRKPLRPQERLDRRRAALRRARRRQLAKEKAQRRAAKLARGRAIRRNCPQAYTIGRTEAKAQGLTIRRSLGNPPLTYMDAHGSLHNEDYRSAYELIRDTI
jgi:hypothetical protein